MSELIVVGFEDTEQADRALNELVRLTKEHLIDLEDAVVAIRSPDGTVRIKQSVNLVGLGAAQGSLSGALWGSLVGLLFLNPLLGFAAGAAVAAEPHSRRAEPRSLAFPGGGPSPPGDLPEGERAASSDIRNLSASPCPHGATCRTHAAPPSRHASALTHDDPP